MYPSSAKTRGQSSVPAIRGAFVVLCWMAIASSSLKLLAQTPTLPEYALNRANAAPVYITTGSDGALWFTESGGSSPKIGRITTSGVITEYTLPAGDNTPSGITLGPDGAIWFAVSGGSKIGRITTAGAVTGFPLQVSTSSYGITFGRDGALWFTGNGFICIGLADAVKSRFCGGGL